MHTRIVLRFMDERMERERPSRRGRRWLREGKRRAANERESRARAALGHERVCAVREIKEAAERAHARHDGKSPRG